MNCTHKDADGICAKLSDDTCRQLCIEGPCTHEVTGEMTTAYDDDGLPYLVSADGSEARHIVELLTAEAEGRLVVLPVIKKGKTLYWIWGDEIMPVHYKGIRGGCVDKYGKYHVTCNMITKKDRTFTHGKRSFTYKAGDKRMFYTEDLGKTVFLTRAEAEAALTAERSTT